MSGTTTLLAIPYPELTDDPDVPADMQALAEGVEAAITAGTKAFDTITLGTADVGPLSGSAYTLVQDLTVTTIGAQTLLVCVQAKIRNDGAATSAAMRVKDMTAGGTPTIWRSQSQPLAGTGGVDSVSFGFAFLYTTPAGGARTLRLAASAGTGGQVYVAAGAAGFNSETFVPPAISAVILV